VHWIGRIREDGHPGEVGDSLLEQPKCLPIISVPARRASPVMFPPGRTKLAMRLIRTGLATATMMMGIVLVAFFATRVAW